ncbi:acyloxyacyl hydrolase [uncultured Sphingomonas sp.]|uniref:acyloxyacyl hydrolase n=1 Tax=uncultured Sphingomonas sp. TaxID=158754 RepID=UPI00262C20FE|nr:acyloxyacyl hydrolase [uncultured Sphingomonas sp.]
MTALLGAIAILASTPLAAQGRGGVEEPSSWPKPEITLGLFDHGSNFHPLGERLTFPDLPPGQIYEGGEENGTVDIQIGYRSAPVHGPLKPRLTAKLQINTAGRTSFASLGAEWRQHVLRGRVYGQFGLGVTIHDGYRFTPDPFAPGLSAREARRRYDIYIERTSWGSRILFNPNAALGVRINDRWGAELVWEHFSHGQIFSDQNPGMDSLGLRLVRRLGK